MGIQLSFPSVRLPNFFSVLREESDSDDCCLSDSAHTTSEGESDDENSFICSNRKSLAKTSCDTVTAKEDTCHVDAVNSKSKMDDTTCYINETFIECTNNSLSQNMMRSSQTLILGELSTVPTVQDDNCDEIDISPNQTDVSECQENVFQPLFESKCESLCDAPTDILRELSDTLLHFRTWNATDKDHEAASSILPIKDTSVSSAFFLKKEH